MTEYLPEDQDLLDEIEDIGETSTGLAFSRQQHRLSVIQIKSTLRSRKTMSDLDRSTSRYSVLLIIFTIALIMIATIQLLFDIVNSQHVLLGIGMFASLLFAIWYLTRKLDPDKIFKDGHEH